jgi:beta-lactamase superfamily II metal-dependent hydrolase
MLSRVALVRKEVSEEYRASIIRVTRTDELGTLAVTSNVATDARCKVIKSYKEKKL